MTTHILEGIGHRHSWAELGVRSAEALKGVGGRMLTAVNNGQVAFEARMTQLTVPQADLQHVADRGELPNPIRDRLLAKKAIEPFFREEKEDSAA
ncbi:MAG TPA: hypothetical protein VGE34_00350 [Candidatus Saccharimonadales bacterium]